MKAVFAIVLAYAVCAYADYTVRTKDDLATFRTECAATFNIPEDRVEQFKKWEFTDDEVTEKYINCVFKKFPIFDDETGFIVDNLVAQLSHGADKTSDEIRTEVLKCVIDKKDEQTVENWAYEGFKCFKKEHLQLIRSSVKKD